MGERQSAVGVPPMMAKALQAYSGRRVFVTGHTGFKGAWLCAWLERLGLIALVGHHHKYENRSPKESSFCRCRDTSGASAHCPRSGFQTCHIADFQIGNAPELWRHLNYSRFADLEIRDTADLEVGATEGRCAGAPVYEPAQIELRVGADCFYGWAANG